MTVIKTLNKATAVFLIVAVGFVVYYASQKSKVVGSEFVAKHNSTTQIVSSATPDSLQNRIVDYGMEYLNTPYVVAGCSADGFDCSGFVYFVFQHFKIDVPRSSAGFENFGKEIPIDKVEKGDILVFLSPTRDAIGHIGIVSKPDGKKSNFIHASSGREMKVIITSLTNEGYTRRFVKAVRVLK